MNSNERGYTLIENPIPYMFNDEDILIIPPEGKKYIRIYTKRDDNTGRYTFDISLKDFPFNVEDCNIIKANISSIQKAVFERNLITIKGGISFWRWENRKKEEV